MSGWELVFHRGVSEGLTPHRPSASTSPLSLSAELSGVAGQQHKHPFLLLPQTPSWRGMVEKERKIKEFKDLSKKMGLQKNTSEKDGVTKDISEIGVGRVHDAAGVIISGVLEGA